MNLQEKCEQRLRELGDGLAEGERIMVTTTEQCGRWMKEIDLGICVGDPECIACAGRGFVIDAKTYRPNGRKQ